MQPTTPTRPVSGTFFEAVQLLRPHPKIRPMSEPCPETLPQKRAATPDGVRWSKSFGTTIVNMPESPHLYTSRKQYEVASSWVLGSVGRLDTDIPPESSPDSGTPSSHSMIFRAKNLFSPRSSIVPVTPEGEKLHGTFCRIKSVVKQTLRQSKKDGVAAASSRNSLRSGFYSASTVRLITTENEEEAEESNTSTISDEPPHTAPLRPVSKFLPSLTISIPDNETGYSVIARYCSSGNEGEEGSISENDSLLVAPLRMRSSRLASVSEKDSSAAETTLHYTPSAKKDDDVFSSETSQVDRPVTNFATKLRNAMETDHGTKTPFTTSTASPMVTPSPSPKLRHTSLNSSPGLRSTSLRSQYSASEPGSSSPVLNKPKMRAPKEAGTGKVVRLAPSLEEGLCADNLKVYEENALAAAAPIVRGVVPDVVDIRYSKVDETFERQVHTVLNHQQPEYDPAVGELVLPDTTDYPSTSMLAATSNANLPAVTSAMFTKSLAAPSSTVPQRTSEACSNSGVSTVVPTMPLQILETIVFSAAYGDAECRALASKLYKEVTEAEILSTGPRWGAREQHLLRQSHLIQELNSLVRLGYLQDEIFETIRSQFFPTGTTEMMENQAFTAYIYRTVNFFLLDEDRATQILELALGDESFEECSPEEEVFFERKPFNSEGFVYDGSTDDDQYQ